MDGKQWNELRDGMLVQPPAAMRKRVSKPAETDYWNRSKYEDHDGMLASQPYEMGPEQFESRVYRSISTTNDKLRSIILYISPVDQPAKDYYKWITKTYGLTIARTEFDDQLRKLNYRVKDSKWTR